MFITMNYEPLYNPQFDNHGYIQVYTGDGKGKTTASLGLILRALGRGWNILMVMFTKGGSNYGELKSFLNLDSVIKNKLTIINAGLDRIVYSDNVSKDDKKAIEEGWQFAKDALNSGEYQMIVLDEANVALDLGLIDKREMLDFLDNKPDGLEIVLTGRNACKEVIERAHLVSEIKPIKHYWDLGVSARKGIEY